jgi:two-component system sensor histidine kinase KdpD
MFTYPLFAFNFSLPGEPVTIICSLTVSVITSAMTTRMIEHNELIVETEKEKMRSNLLRAISHDLRTPLTTILGASSTVIEHDEALTHEERIRLMHSIKDDSQWLISMMENLLSVTRMESEEANITKIAVPVEEVVAGAIAKFNKRFPNYTVRAVIPDELLMPPMDPMLIEQVLLNLLENTVFHAPQATQRCIQVTRKGKNVLFEVIDNGNGIEREVLTRMRNKRPLSGKRPHGQTDARRHMGIGLSVCSSIIQAHGGTMNAQNAPSGGAVFSFTLPLELQEE